MYGETKCEVLWNNQHSVRAEHDINLAASDTHTHTHTADRWRHEMAGLNMTRRRRRINCELTSWCCDWGSLRPEALGGNCRRALPCYQHQQHIQWCFHGNYTLAVHMMCNYSSNGYHDCQGRTDRQTDTLERCIMLISMYNVSIKKRTVAFSS